MANTWNYRHCDDQEIWQRLLSRDFPEILFILPSGESFGDEDSNQRINIPSPLIYRDLLLALDTCQGYMFIPITYGYWVDCYWVYVDEEGDPCLFILRHQDDEESSIVEDEPVTTLVSNIFLHKSIVVEAGAQELIDIIIVLGKEIIPLEKVEDLYLPLTIPERQKGRIIILPPTIDEILHVPTISYWQTAKEYYKKIVIVKTSRGYNIIAIVEKGIDYKYSFEYITSPKIDYIHALIATIINY